MKISTPWFDRAFDFSFPVAQTPFLVERLRGLLPRLEAKLSGLTEERLVARIGDSWSIQENVGHLADLEPLWLGRIDDLMAEIEVMRPADLTNSKTHGADHNLRGFVEVLAEIRDQRGKLMGRIDTLADDDFSRVALHPRLEKPMRLVDLLLFVAEHDDHHLARIHELLSRS